MCSLSRKLSLGLSVTAVFIIVNMPTSYGGVAQNRLGVISNPHIIKGNDTDIEKVPYQVAIEKLRIQSCGGSILSDTWVVTAAQCVHPDTSGVFGKRIRAGSTTAIPIIGWSGSIHEIERTEIHPLFDVKYLDFDIAMLKVSNKFVFSSRVQPIKATKYEYLVDYKANATISGWGKTSVGSWWQSSRLQSAQVPLFKTDDCVGIIRKNKLGVNISNRMICAGGNGSDIYIGDHGGPLVQKGQLIGIASWNIRKSNQQLSVYTYVVRYDMRIFISSHTGF